MKDHDFDIQVFDQSARKEGEGAPLPVACSCNKDVHLLSQGSERIGPSGCGLCRDRELHYTQICSSSTMEMRWFWPLLKIFTRLDGLLLCVSVLQYP